jgi:hypothetical protein
MIALTFGSPKLLDLSEGSVRELLKLLQVTTSLDVSSFQKQPEGERDFYNFFFDVLIEQNVPCAIDIDWKWSP